MTEVEDAHRGDVDELDVGEINDDIAVGQREQCRHRLRQQQRRGDAHITMEDEYSGRHLDVDDFGRGSGLDAPNLAHRSRNFCNRHR